MSWRQRASACALLTAVAAAGVEGQEGAAPYRAGAHGRPPAAVSSPQALAAGPFARGSARPWAGTPYGPQTPQKPAAPWPGAWASGPQALQGNAPDPALVTLLSLGLPGAGQHVLGKRRKWIYLAAEAVGWTFYLERRAAGGRFRDRYRDFAWENARLSDGPRVDGDFRYYETLTHWTRSGAFDVDPQASGLQPEPDEETYNGQIWALARQIHLPAGAPAVEGTPGYEQALAYYQERAYGPPFLWDWSALPGGQVELARLIEASDDRFRQATTVLGAVLANHLISSIDAYVSARGLPRTGLRVRPEVRPGRGSWMVTWALPLR